MCDSMGTELAYTVAGGPGYSTPALATSAIVGGGGGLKLRIGASTAVASGAS